MPLISTSVIAVMYGLDQKARYRGLAKNGAQSNTLFALANLWMARQRLLAMAG